MEIQRPFTVVTTSVDGDVLRVLASSDAEFSVPRLHQLIPERSVVGIRSSLARLVAQGIVVSHGIGRSNAYALNDDHLAASAVRQIAGLKRALLTRLREHVAAWHEPPVFASLYGSAARGEMRPDSDLDILLVRRDDASLDEWGANLARLTKAATAWTGNDTRIIDLAVEEVTDAATQPLLTTIAAEGIAFSDDADWLRKTLRRKGRR